MNGFGFYRFPTSYIPFSYSNLKARISVNPDNKAEAPHLSPRLVEPLKIGAEWCLTLKHNRCLPPVFVIAFASCSGNSTTGLRVILLYNPITRQIIDTMRGN